MQKITVKVSGMACEMCEKHVNDAVSQVLKVKKVTSSHQKGETVILTEDVLDEAKLRTALTEAGYQAMSIQSEPYKKFKLFGK